MATAAVTETSIETDYITVLLEARNDEAFMIVLDRNLQKVETEKHVFLSDDLFLDYSKEKKIAIVQLNTSSFKNILKKRDNTVFLSVEILPQSMINLSVDKYRKNKFAQLAKVLPKYLKEVHIRE